MTVMRARLLLVVASIFFATDVSRADELPAPAETCTVNRKCSSTGVACVSGDRACMNDATARGLEIFCEDKQPPAVKLVYCPPDTGRADSKVIWLLLAAATFLAVGGSVVAWLALKKKA